jgi:hypothetical protein
MKPSRYWSDGVNGKSLSYVQQSSPSVQVRGALQTFSSIKDKIVDRIEDRRVLDSIEGRRAVFDDIALAHGFDPLISANWYSRFNEISRRQVYCLLLISFMFDPIVCVGIQVDIKTLLWWQIRCMFAATVP